MEILKTILYEPIYNFLVLFLDVLPGADLGLAIIGLTVLIKLVLLPLSYKGIKAQRKVKEIEPELKALREKYKDDRETQALKMMELYRERNVKPFSGFALLLIQIPIILALYYVILRGGLPALNLDIIYSFVPIPEAVNIDFLGFINVTEKSFILAGLTALTQYAQTHLSFGKQDDKKSADAPAFGESFKSDFARSLKLQMRYVFPLIVGVIAYTLSAAIALYWTTSNLFHIGQELVIKRKLAGETEQEIEGEPSSVPENGQ